MAVNTQRFSTIIANATAAVQGAASALVDFSVGSISLAFMQASGAIALWLQGIALQVAALTRLSTSTGADVDSYLADFGFKRLAAVSATGQVTFSRFTPTLQALIPAGTLVQTADGTQQFTVIADTNQSAWNAGLNSYVIASSVSSCTATIQAVNAGSVGNVAAGLITVIGASIVGVDTVTNASGLTGGADEQSDASARAAFVLYLENLTEGTKQACINAVVELQEGASCSITENVNYSGFPQPGYFYAIVDDGTGSPSPTFLSAAYAAIDKVRAEGTIFGVFAPIIVTANIAMTLTIAAGYTGSTVRAQVSAALAAFVNALTEGQTLPYARLGQIAFDASAGVTNVTAITLNGGTSDLTATSQQLIRTGTVTVS
jgi:uncharacterized phage protein gp47/JayE